ncbi:mitochondrial transcription termination factor [Dermacentor variabilis]|uniref:mitochondrial transcription termination factor n=1 Tax=Dermacentor variabilis TaxID=34621 RepID=UPI003F5B2726
MAACGVVWFRLLVLGRRCSHHIPASFPAKRLLISVTVRALQRCWAHEACSPNHRLRLAPLYTNAPAQDERCDLCSLLGFDSEPNYRAWQREHKDVLFNVPDDRLENTCRWLLSERLEREALRKHPAVLKFSANTLRRRLAVIRQEEEITELSSDAVLALLSSSESLLSYVSDKGGICTTLRDRMLLLCEELSLSEQECLDLISRVPCLLSHDRELLKRKLRILRECGISKEAVLKDPWVFRHSESLMAKRAMQCRALGIPIRTWLLRCPEHVLQRHVQIWRASRRVLGAHPDTPEYLAERLHRTCLEDLVRRHPRLLSIRPPKLKEVLDLLFTNGYTAEQVCQYPRVLSSSASRLRRRLQWLATRQVPLPSLYALLLSEKAFERTYGKFSDEHHHHEPAPSRPPECQTAE